MSKKKDTWEAITGTLRAAIPSSEYQTWFSRLRPVALEPRRAVLEVPNKFVATWLEDRYLSNLQRAFQENLKALPEIRFTYPIQRPQGTSSRSRTIRSSSSAQSTGLFPELTFARFVSANSNRFALSCARAVADGKALDYSPLYIYGTTGSGKTHLLHAIGNQLVGTDPLASVRYLPLRDLSSQFSRAARSRNLMAFRGQLENLDFLLLDNVHRLDGQENLQHHLVPLLDPVRDTRPKIVVAGKNPPAQVRKLIPQLRSRLEGGLLVEIQAPEPATKIKVIAASAKEHNLTVPDDVAFFLATAAKDLKMLQRYLTALETYASLHDGAVELSTAKWIVHNKNTDALSVSSIQRLSAEYFNITLSKLLSNKKDRVFSYPRQIAMYLSRRLTDASYKEIGKAFGNKDHSTIIYAVKRIEAERRKKTQVREDIRRIQKLLV
jgi:chromosomal replication initiator protein